MYISNISGDIMNANGIKEDLRIIKTKRALIDAFGKMMQEQPYEKLTVNELCDRAGVRRATFYKHFKDKNDFLIYLIKEDRDSFKDKKWQGKSCYSPDYFISYISNLVENLAKNSALVENLMSSSAKHVFMECLISQNHADTLAIFQEAEIRGEPIIASSENLASMFIGGIAVVIYNWCRAGMVQPKEELIAELSSIISSIMPE